MTNYINNRYKIASKLEPQNTKKAVLNGKPEIVWEDEAHFSYVRDIDQSRKEVVYIDCDNGNESSKPYVDPENNNRFSGDISVSPDGRYGVFIREYNLYLKSLNDSCEIQLTFDGQEQAPYASPSHHDIKYNKVLKGKPWKPDIIWSPDSSRIVTYKYDERAQKPFYLLKSWYEQNNSDFEFIPYYRQCAKDCEISYYKLCIIDVNKREIIELDGEMPFDEVSFGGRGDYTAKWLNDSSGFWYTYVGRAFREARLEYVDAKTGHVKTVVRETSAQFLNVSDCMEQVGYGEYRFSNMITPDKKYAIWQSERTGKAHFYLYDLKTGKCIRDITPFDSIACKIVYFDAGSGTLFFTANNISGMSEPYYHVLCSANIDGSGVTVLTPEDGEHTITFSGKYIVDTWSRIDKPPITVLRKIDGSLVRTLEEADIKGLIDLGYSIPERFQIKSADGKEDIYGIIVKPSNLDMNKKYPVIDYIYGGPQMYNTPKRFIFEDPGRRELLGGLEVYAQLGFVGIIMDGRGTPGRGTKFHWYSNENLHKCCGLEDHVSAIEQLKKKYPFIDTNRVGIWGSSAGGAATVRAILEYPDVYKVAVASAGNYDNRNYAAGWTEHYYGPYNEETFSNGDVASIAGNLKGKLMLVHGMIDWNVVPAHVIRLADALVQANKDFELVLLPRCGHMVPQNKYFQRKKMDFFIDNL